MVSQRILDMTPSATSTLGGKISEMKGAGINIAAFNLGEPDFPTPQKVADACTKAMLEGKTKYIAIGGIIQLRQAITEKLRRDNNLTYTPDQICVSTGAKQAVYNAVMALCNPGDEVIIPTPCWVSYVEMVKLAGGVPILVKTDDRFHIIMEEVKNAVTDKTKLIIINTPNNPTGAVYSRDTLEQLAQLAVEKDIYIIADEVYEKLIYGNVEHVSIASLSPGIYDKTIVVNGFSKSYSMTGWRVGYAAGPKDVIKGMTSLQGHVTTNSTTFIQWAAITALQECEEEVEAMRKEFERRREFMYERLNLIPGMQCPKPEGAFYLMPNVSYYLGKKYKNWSIQNAGDLCDYILEEAKVAIVPGNAFEAPETVRFAYSVSIETIAEGMERLERALNHLT
ncbi:MULTISPECIES: pyridoxal phosphate-dependent aminotransferase [unclassified Clostridium]|jgi:aspartate aminotransferase|uniref:pyridoxal phosphate-dependent aminotransferase n=1 Tax=unclassified Clostridium TaxID=2614128 RepID=UPI001105A40F|nr:MULTISPECIES: pyridoxal phosphate-dependent aminotransferase [unclassified Clostridium]